MSLRIAPRIGALTPSTRHQWPVDSELEKRQVEKARELGANSVKPIYIEDQPDTFVKPLDYTELGAIW